MKTSIVAALLMVVSSLAFSQEDTKLLQAENNMLKATVKSQQSEIVDLKSKLAKADEPLKAKVADLEQQLKAAGDENAKAEAEVEALKARVKTLEGFVNALKAKPENSQKLLVPLVGDETPLTKVKTSPKDYVNKTFIIIGGITAQDYYNFRYGDAKDTHMSFSLRELRQDGSPTREEANLYFRRGNAARDLVEAITAMIKDGKDGKLVRVKVTVDPARYDDGSSMMFEMVDYQFLKDDDKTAWGEWHVGQPQKPKQEGGNFSKKR